ncbi:MAG TPA: hypothetical protein DCQ98_20070 [Planctomycetaceae bacterium]|nr:hypothetical protein [Planctomycetaceae bacterium]
MNGAAARSTGRSTIGDAQAKRCGDADSGVVGLRFERSPTGVGSMMPGESNERDEPIERHDSNDRTLESSALESGSTEPGSSGQRDRPSEREVGTILAPAGTDRRNSGAERWRRAASAA